MRDYCMYMLRCADGSYYVGMTNSLQRRLEEHTRGLNEDCYTYKRRPLTLVYSMAFCNVWDAIHAETVVKAWSRKKKETLIAGDERLLKLFSKKKFPKRFKRKFNAQHGFACESMRFLVRSRLPAHPAGGRRELLGMTDHL